MRHWAWSLFAIGAVVPSAVACAKEGPTRAPALGASGPASPRPSGGTHAARSRGEGPAEPSAPRRSGEGSAEASASGTRDDGRAPVAVLRGEASYYGDSLAGHKTANGERYDPRAFTAAHRTLPFGTLLRVVRTDTRASVVVRVTDRGPFGSSRRILDLSRAAAERLGMIRRGVAEVRAEILEYGPRRRR